VANSNPNEGKALETLVNKDWRTSRGFEIGVL
jgi:hypothetical protein